MKIVTRTILANETQTAKLTGKPHVYDEHTTLNEKLGIQAGVLPSASQVPVLGYYVIGRGGHGIKIGADSKPYVAPLKHRTTDFALFDQMPFVLREINDDLTSIQRARYCLRRLETHNNINYVAYYGKRLVLPSTAIQKNRTVVTDGLPTTTPFVATSANLNPVPPAPSSTGVVTSTGDYLSVSLPMTLSFDANDVVEYLNVANILFGNEEEAVISEISLCTGVDSNATGQGAGNTTFNYTEVIGCQIHSHITTHYPIAFITEGFETSIEVGANEPMVGIDTSSVTTVP